MYTRNKRKRSKRKGIWDTEEIEEEEEEEEKKKNADRRGTLPTVTQV
jgi:hypothetical protein